MLCHFGRFVFVQYFNFKGTLDFSFSSYRLLKYEVLPSETAETASDKKFSSLQPLTPGSKDHLLSFNLSINMTD